MDLLAVQGTLKSLLQHHSSKASILQHSAFFIIQLSHPYMTTGKTVPGLPHCRRILYQLSHKGSPGILDWIAYPFSSGSSDLGIKLGSPALQADSLPTELSGKPFQRLGEMIFKSSEIELSSVELRR